MIHGLLWLPLLVFFFWITWAGWNEYQKVETYKQWATQFERAKYDIYAALGQTERTLTWGTPTRHDVIETQTTQLDQVQATELLVKGSEAFSLAVKGALKKSAAIIQLKLHDGTIRQIPFTDAELAGQWHHFLMKTLAMPGEVPENVA